MTFDVNNLEGSLYEIFDQVKCFLSQELWENILMNCTKNELFILIQLKRYQDVNMSQIAQYLNIPLNTTTGIVSRMEKKGILIRVRSNLDKRVVTIQLTEAGEKQVDSIISAYIDYSKKILADLSVEEIALLGKVFGKVIKILTQDKSSKDQPIRKLRKITIE